MDYKFLITMAITVSGMDNFVEELVKTGTIKSLEKAVNEELSKY